MLVFQLNCIEYQKKVWKLIPFRNSQMTLNELYEFNQFVLQQTEEDLTTLPLEECVEIWRKREIETEDFKAIQRGVQDFEHGRIQSWNEVKTGIEQQLKMIAK